MLLPRTCPLCRRPGPAPCRACAAELRPAPRLPAPVGVDECRAVLAYEGAGRELVARLKYRNARSSVPWLAGAMAVTISGLGPFDAVTWVPTTASRRRRRGFDQSVLLARAVAHRLRVPRRRLLVRRPGAPQTGRSLVERRRGPRLVPRGRAPARVLLVDDVVTSGSTVTAAALALRRAGAQTIVVVAAARTPPGRRSSGSQAAAGARR
jgi:predicted amidophosphoribosyltransferase